MASRSGTSQAQDRESGTPEAQDRDGGKPQAPDRDWQPESPVESVKRELQQTTVQETSGWKQAKHDLTDQLIAQGVSPKRAARVAEATIRRAQAKEGRTVFHYADVEQEFEQRARSAGADPRRIEEGKRRVWTAARATADSNGVPIEEALFFCYAESLDVHADFLTAVAAGDERAEAKETEARPPQARRTGSTPPPGVQG